MTTELETTEFVRLDAQKPPTVGWYIASFHKDKRVRRWWNGITMSRPVYQGESDQLAEVAKNTPTSFLDRNLYWCGLKAEHPDGYGYALTPTEQA